jgi:ribonuclease BN (tRNA processing enzyme)
VDAMSVTVLGCSGSYPGPGGACSGYLVRARDIAVAVDLGNGSLANLQRHLDLAELDAVVLSHSHADHWVDLTGLRVALHYVFGREGLPVYGTGETKEMAAATTHGFEPTFDWRLTGDGDEFEIGPLRFHLSATDHYVETLAVRVDDPLSDRSLAYSADTGPDWSFRRLGSDVDLALCESTFPTDDEAEGVLHLSARQAGAMAADAGARRLVLTHLWPGTDPDQHRRIGSEAFGRAVDIAAIDERYEL